MLLSVRLGCASNKKARFNSGFLYYQINFALEVMLKKSESGKILNRIVTHRIQGLNLGDGFVLPNYDGYSILNIPPSVTRLFSIPAFGVEPLSDEILAPLEGNVRNIILILMDALAYHRLVKWIAGGTVPLWKDLGEKGVFTPITSITPSTTAAALTTLWTGCSAATHGITGYVMWLKEYGIVANAILHAPISYMNDVGSLSKAGFDPRYFLSCPSFGMHLADNGISVHSYLRNTIIRSGLSTMLFRGSELHSFHTAAEMWVDLRELLETSKEVRNYAWIYWGEVDHYGHIYGPDDERTVAEFVNFTDMLERLFLSRLNPEIRKDTLLILTADHGQIFTPKEADFELRNHPVLDRMLHISPTGENRLAYLYLKPGKESQAVDYVQHNWPGKFEIIESRRAVTAGLFGTDRINSNLLDRIGDYILIARDDAYLWGDKKENPLLGRHGGLHTEEMIVPFLAVNLSSM